MEPFPRWGHAWDDCRPDDMGKPAIEGAGLGVGNGPDEQEDAFRALLALEGRQPVPGLSFEAMALHPEGGRCSRFHRLDADGLCSGRCGNRQRFPAERPKEAGLAVERREGPEGSALGAVSMGGPMPSMANPRLSIGRGGHPRRSLGLADLGGDIPQGTPAGPAVPCVNWLKD